MTKIEQKIPEGWSVKKLENCFSFSAGGDVDKDCFSFTQDEAHPYPIYANALTNQGLYGYSSKYKIAVECITITGRGDIGKVFYRKGYFTPIVRLITAIPKQGIDAKFMSFSCSRICFYNETTGVPQLTVPQVQKYKLMVPPLPEQEKIAGILSCWDDGIEKLSALIEKKKIQKKALMQQLLTGKHRLKGFSTPWHEVRLRDIAEKITRKNLNQYTNVVTISAQNGFILQQQFFSKSVVGEDLSSYNLLKCGEFGYNRSYSKGFPMGAIKRLDLFNVAPVSSLYICFSVNEYMDSNFMVNYFDAGLQNYELYKVAQEGARNHGLLNISLHDFFNIKLYIPSDIAEQKAIAEILSKADEEIELLNKKLEAFKQEKKALMQQLLTGKIRVKVN
ncbi:MAG: restriction endonuclease subunit S [Alphaproteobacteria bacterium]|nr:restriction endonuclease subunit S [Alphaproteobacteria bacterium]